MNTEQKLNSEQSAENGTKPLVSRRFELSEQQLIDLEECVADIEPAIKYLRETNIGIVNGLKTDVCFKLIKAIVGTIRNQTRPKMAANEPSVAEVVEIEAKKPNKALTLNNGKMFK